MSTSELRELLQKKEILERTIRFGSNLTDDSMQKLMEKFFEIYTKNTELEMVLHLTSPGGITSHCFSFYDMVKLYQPKLIIITSGNCASAAIPMLLAAKKENRFCTKHSSFLIHPSKKTFKEWRVGFAELKEELENMGELEDVYGHIVLKETTMTKKEFSREQATERKTSLKQALKWNLVSKVLE